METRDRKLARNIEAKIRSEIIEGNYFEKSIGQSKTFNDMMEKFMAEHAPKVSRNTQSSYSTSLGHLVPYFGTSDLLSISPKMISRYKIVRKEEGAKPASINIELAMLTKAFNLAAKEWEWLKENPASKVAKEKENNERDRWLTVDEEKRLLANSPEWLKEIIVFALNTGLRRTELLSLEWSRVDLERRTILLVKTKNGKPRTIPLNQNALSVLKKKSDGKVRSLKNDYVFTSSEGTKIKFGRLARDFNKAIRKAGIEAFTFHSLRHTFCTRLAQEGIDLYKIAKLAGHKDIKMTQRYSHHCPDSLRAGVEILDSDYKTTTIEKKSG
ncbi:MAG: tyrosine-type recombinase/integrase [Deltaproteobacteria bacterium]|nr:tyrosine-type recombinase/integrase [Deltaproteobacteria bacterium]